MRHTFKLSLLMLSMSLYQPIAQASCVAAAQECRVNAIKGHEELGLNNYVSWAWLTGYEASGLHWNQFISLSMNKGIKEYKKNYALYLQSFLEDDDDEDEDEEETSATQSKYKTYPVGTTIVKENYLSDQGKPGDLSSVTVMHKREKGFDTGAGDWEYFQFGSDGQLFFRGGSKKLVVKHSCHSCHMNVAERDFVFATMLSVQTSDADLE
jgi:hypothetical protein